MKILIYHTGSLGDTLVAAPALRAVRENFPDAHITMLTDEQPGRGLVQPREILKGLGLVDDYILYPFMNVRTAISLLLRLRKRKFDCLIYMILIHKKAHHLPRDRCFFRLAGIKRNLGLRNSFFRSPPKQHGTPMAEVPRAADTLLSRFRLEGLKTPNSGKARIDIDIGKKEHDNVDRWLSGLPFDGKRRWYAVGLGSKMPCKIWPFERYLGVSRNLTDRYDLWPVVFGGPSDRELAERMVRELGRGYVAAGELGVRDSIAAMERCLFYLGNDTGTMHMAASCGLKCVAPFSSRAAPGIWDPYGEGHVIFRTPVPCEGCDLEVCEVHGMKCILSITEEQVLKACAAVCERETQTPATAFEIGS